MYNFSLLAIIKELNVIKGKSRNFIQYYEQAKMLIRKNVSNNQTLTDAIVMGLIIRIKPRDPAAARRGCPVSSLTVHAHV
jgi:hypothetical protein